VLKLKILHQGLYLPLASVFRHDYEI
jgi:hypothetical protein